MKLPRKALTNFDIIHLIKKLKIPHFRGVFMRNHLPKKVRKFECGIVNLDNYENEGTHWTAYVKRNEEVIYFDSYGNLKPPLELINYFLSDSIFNKIRYNYESYQDYNSYVCGQLCLIFLYNVYHSEMNVI